jgi:hypothetical protein
MESSRFDGLSRGLASGKTRRFVLKALTVSAAGGLGLVGLRPHGVNQAALAARLQDSTADERGVLLFEGLAMRAEFLRGSCDELAQAMQQYLAENAEIWTSTKAAQESWTRDERIAHTDRYGDRLQAAAEKILVARQKCHYVKGAGGATPEAAASPSAGCGQRRGTQALAAPNALQDACDCNSTCPQSWWDCVESGASCAAGDDCECCYLAMCGHTSHCLDDCNSSECCSEPCSNYSPPSGGGSD